jgi:hypothetical protein
MRALYVAALVTLLLLAVAVLYLPPQTSMTPHTEALCDLAGCAEQQQVVLQPPAAGSALPIQRKASATASFREWPFAANDPPRVFSSSAVSSGTMSSGADSSGARSSGADSSGADSSGADSSGARSSGADSSGARSSGADSSGARSSGADSSGADSSGARSSGADSSGNNADKASRPQNASDADQLVTATALRATFGKDGVIECRKVVDDWDAGVDSGRYCEFRVRNGQIRRLARCQSYRPYWQLYTGLLVSAARSAAAEGRPLPDARLCVYEGCKPRKAKRSALLQWCVGDAEALALPSPYEAPCVYKHRYALTLAHHQRLLASRAAPPPWTERAPVAVWRGALTGAGASKWFDRGGEKPHQRVKLSLIAQQHPSELDVGLYPAHRHGKLVRGRHGSLFGRVEDALGDADYARYKFVIDLDGDGCSGRLGKLLYLGSVVLKPEWDGWYPFYHKLLRPWVHYVPIADDLSDLLEKLAWLREHDQRARQIAEAGVALARGLLTPRAVASIGELHSLPLDRGLSEGA